MDGGSGDDTFIGSAADDSLYVSDGLYSSDGSGNETVYGRDGNDSINMVDGEPGDIANGQAGVDTCSVDAGDSAVDCES